MTEQEQNIEDVPTKDDVEGQRPAGVGKVPGEDALPQVQNPGEAGDGDSVESDAVGDGPSGGAETGGGTTSSTGAQGAGPSGGAE